MTRHKCFSKTDTLLLGANTWTQITDFNGTFAPPLRSFHSAIYHTPSNSMVVLGGFGGASNLLSDIRVLNLGMNSS